MVCLQNPSWALGCENTSLTPTCWRGPKCPSRSQPSIFAQKNRMRKEKALVRKRNEHFLMNLKKRFKLVKCNRGERPTLKCQFKSTETEGGRAFLWWGELVGTSWGKWGLRLISGMCWEQYGCKHSSVIRLCLLPPQKVQERKKLYFPGWFRLKGLVLRSWRKIFLGRNIG